MATKKKLLQAAAGTAAAGGAALNVEDVFSTYLYTGNATQRDVANSIDLSTEGGLVWIKNRDVAVSNHLYDTERGATKRLMSDATNAEYSTTGYGVIGFNTDGFELGTHSAVNNTGDDYASWTFRKAPKFFTCVTYSGNGVAGRTISHDLNSEVGCLIVKRTDTTGEWMVWHKDVAAINSSYALQLQSTNAATGFSTSFNSTAPTSTEFTLGNNSKTNNASGTYVAYLFAHNDGDGDFGPTGDQDIIKCGSYTGNGSTNGPEINLGFEPQWLLYKNTSTGGTAWVIVDNMRGIATGGDDALLQAQTSGTELSSGYNYNDLQANGFKVTTTADGANTNGNNYIYIAIRRGPMAVPESATDVFDIATRDATHPSFDASFDTVDFSFVKNSASTGSWRSFSRLQGQNYMSFDLTNAEALYTAAELDHMDGWSYGVGTSSTFYSWMWRRAPNYFDVVAYTGNGTAGRTVSHNLGVAPEMIWVKRRNTAAGWPVYHSALGNSKYLSLNNTDAASGSGTAFWNSTSPTATEFTVDGNTRANGSGDTYIAYLFASLDGVSKVGSYTGNGSTQNIDCGFSSGARFVLIKCSSDGLTDWHVMDSTRGIVAGNDPWLMLNDTAAEDTGEDIIDPYSSGFALPANNRVNTSGRTYIFYAIA